MGIIDKIAGVIGGAIGLVDDLHTSDEERGALKNALLVIKADVMTSLLQAEVKLMEHQSAIIVAEAQSKHWITSAWRPITMLTFLGIIVLASFGWVDTASLTAVPDRLWTLLTVGIGGYAGGRSLEKTAEIAASAFTSAQRNR